MTRATLLSLAALGAILAGCSPAPAEEPGAAVATNATVNTPANDANAPVTSASNGGPTAKADDAGQPAGSLKLKKREPMAGFKMVSTKGETLTNDSLKGKVVLLDFWATWCAPCKAASPTMEKLHKAYAQQGLQVIGANASEESDKEGAAAKYAKEHGYTYTFTKNNDSLAETIGISGIPCFIFIDKQGNVREVAEGFDPDATPAQFEAKVKELLAEA